MDFDPCNPAVRADPHSFWSRLRDHDPVYRTVGPFDALECTPDFFLRGVRSLAVTVG